ncbi:MAG: DUF2911 domain-containing protein [bacterium]
MKLKLFPKSSIFIALILGLSGSGLTLAWCQSNPLHISPRATISQKIGDEKITIDYGRPGVKNRRIWGELVPYGMAPGIPFSKGKPFPWRGGANENTTISFSHDVTVQGQALEAGTYGLHLIPTEKEWTLIFSHNSTSWGSFSYDKAEDALRVQVTPIAASHQEWLRYGFDVLTPRSATVFLHWEKLKVPFEVVLVP